MEKKKKKKQKSVFLPKRPSNEELLTAHKLIEQQTEDEADEYHEKRAQSWIAAGNIIVR